MRRQRNFCTRCGIRMPPGNTRVQCNDCESVRCVTCRGEVPYSGRGRPRKWCDSCLEMMKRDKSIQLCRKCGTEIEPLYEGQTHRRVCGECQMKRMIQYQRDYYVNVTVPTKSHENP